MMEPQRTGQSDASVFAERAEFELEEAAKEGVTTQEPKGCPRFINSRIGKHTASEFQ